MDSGHEALYIQDIRKAVPPALLFQKAEFFQFRQQLHGFSYREAEVLLDLGDLVDDEHPVFLIEPVVLPGERHAVQKYRVQYLFLQGEA